MRSMQLEVDAAQLSDVLFGRPCRLPLAMWILEREKPRFFQSEPPRGVGVPTAIRQELSRLVIIGMLEEERPSGENRVYYIRTNSELWKIIRTAIEVL
jgi:hypothetical protein